MTSTHMEWKPIDTAPKDGTVFLAWIDGLPYGARYDEEGRFVRYEHGNVTPGASYRVHQIDGKRLLEEIEPAGEPVYRRQGSLWKRGFEAKPTHWTKLTSPHLQSTRESDQ